ncbi:unnamed protein product [Urochloa humidicola]
MVETRRTATGAGSNQNQQPPPPPPPMTMEQLMTMQTQLMQQMAQSMAMMQQNQQNPPSPQAPPAPPRDKRGEFMKGRPPTFTQASDPLEADDWLKTIKRELDIAQCSDREKVLYGAGQLRGAALDWWDSYQYAHANRAQITRQEFCDRFCSHHVPDSLG